MSFVEWLAARRNEAGEEPLSGQEATSEAIPEEGKPPGSGSLREAECPDLEIVCLNDVQVEPIEWLWPSRIAIGKITVLAGDPGLGKSTLSLSIAAHVSCGRPWPDCPSEENKTGSVLLLSGEDGLADTIKLRLLAAGADQFKVHAIKAARKLNGEYGPFNLQTDLRCLEQTLTQYDDIRLLIIDPISCYLGQTDDNKNGAVRGLLAPLAALAEQFHIAVLLVSHLNKASGGKSTYRLMGSLAFSAAARAVWMLARDPKDQDRILLLQSKNNLAPRTAALACRIKDGKVNWEPDTIDMTADDLFTAEATADRTPNEVGRAAGFLRELLAAGPIPANEVAQRAEDLGISERTLVRAKKVAQARSRRVTKEDGTGEEWRWYLTSLDSEPGQDGPPPDTGEVGDVGYLGGLTCDDHDDTADFDEVILF